MNAAQEQSLRAQPVREQPVHLGRHGSMLGILTPGAADRDSNRPCIVILNAGVVHRVGPSRLHVLIARRLAAAGFTVVRFDQSGIGDSDRRTDGLTPLDAALADIDEALDSLEAKLHRRRFILFGLCSGADQAVLYAGRDPRVTGVIFVDPHIPRTYKYYLYYYGRRMLRGSSWLNILRGRHPMFHRPSPAANAPADRPDGELIRQLTSKKVREFLENGYRAALARDNRLLAVFTGGLEAQHCYREQLLDAFPTVPFGSRLRLEYFGDADHMFESKAQRGALIDLITGWLGQL
jgi:pimeloyl-ACP methyl ester carboxylesterase